MSRLTRILTMTAGSVLLFALFAVAGWAITDWLTSEDQAGEDTVAMLQYPLVPVQGDEESTLEWIAEQQAFTSQAMADPTNPDALLGDPAAGGQSIRVVPASSLPDTGTTGTVPTTVGDESGGGSGGDGTTGSGSTDPESGDGDSPDDGSIPFNMFADAPYLINRIDLSDVIFDGVVGPLNIDICAGSDVLPSTPGGCPTGFGGTIIPLSDDIPSDDTEVGGRPPTGMTASGTDTLAVRAFRRSSVREEIVVQAKEYPPAALTPAAVCDPGDGAPRIFDYYEPTTTIPIDTSGGPSLWPFDPAFDTLDVFTFGLEEGTRYAICVYWLDSSGVRVVSYWQAMQVSTASGNRFSVYYSGFRRDGFTPPVNPVESVAVKAFCNNFERSSWGDEPGGVSQFPQRGQKTYEARLLCRANSLSGFLQTGGFWVDVSLIDLDGFVDATQRSWVNIDRFRINCRTLCRTDFAVSLPMPSVEHEFWDPGGRSAIPPTFHSAGVVWLGIDFENDGGGNQGGWLLGAIQSFDTANRVIEVPPILTSVEMLQVFPSRLDSGIYLVNEFSFAADRSFRIQNDVPVSVEADLMGVDNGDLVEPCIAGGGPAPAYRSSAPAVDHTFTLERLCLGAFYALVVTALDADGVAYDVVDRRFFYEKANRFIFTTNTLQPYDGGRTSEFPYSVDLVAELQLGPLPSAGRSLVWEYQVDDLEVVVDNSELRGEFPQRNEVGVTHVPALDYDFFLAGWSVSHYQLGTIRQQRSPGYPLEQPPPLGFDIPGVVAREQGIQISQGIRLILRELPRTRSGDGAIFDQDDMTISSEVTLTQLLEGVTIWSPVAAYPRLVVRAVRVTALRARSSEDSFTIWTGS